MVGRAFIKHAYFQKQVQIRTCVSRDILGLSATFVLERIRHKALEYAHGMTALWQIDFDNGESSCMLTPKHELTNDPQYPPNTVKWRRLRSGAPLYPVDPIRTAEQISWYRIQDDLRQKVLTAGHVKEKYWRQTADALNSIRDWLTGDPLPESERFNILLTLLSTV